MSRTTDKFELMRLLVRIAETGSLTAAGRALGLSQPSVSRQLSALESALGAQLVMRTTHELTFTEAGVTFLSEARQLLAGWEAAVERAGSVSTVLKGRIRVAAPTGLGQTVLADLVGSFVAAHPEVSIEWSVLDDPTDMVAEGIDLWLRVGAIQDESLIVRSIWTIERVVVTARKADVGIVHPRDLEQEPAIVLGPYVGSRIELTASDGTRHTLEPRALVSTDNIFAAQRLTVAGHGYSILPLWLVEGKVDAGELRVICPGWRPPLLSLSLAYPQTRFRPARVRAFVDHIRADLPVIGGGITQVG